MELWNYVITIPEDFTQRCREAEFAENFQLSVSIVFDVNCTKVF